MPSLEQLIKERKQKEQKRAKPLTQEELGVPLKEFQKYAIHEMGVSDYFFLMCGRGLGRI